MCAWPGLVAESQEAHGPSTAGVYACSHAAAGTNALHSAHAYFSSADRASTQPPQQFTCITILLRVAPLVAQPVTLWGGRRYVQQRRARRTYAQVCRGDRCRYPGTAQETVSEQQQARCNSTPAHLSLQHEAGGAALHPPDDPLSLRAGASKESIFNGAACRAGGQGRRA